MADLATPTEPASDRATMSTSPASPASSNRRMMGKLALFALLMFGFGWAMVPLYNAICEVTGLRVLTKRDDGAERVARNTQVDTTRTIVVEFDSNIHGPWEFRAKARSVRVHPGELATVEYELRNLSDRRMSGQAIPSYAPSQSARHFRKVQCFCFEQQTLEGREERRPDHAVVHVLRRRAAGRARRRRRQAGRRRSGDRQPRQRWQRWQRRRGHWRRGPWRRLPGRQLVRPGRHSQTMTEKSPSRASLAETFKAIGAAFFGVRSGKAHDSDMSRLNPVHVILAGVIAAAAFIGLLVVAVKLMLRASGAA
jgi:cytochrome c oxidase assembly protein subunit 11